jgi:hypothetical protein
LPGTVLFIIINGHVDAGILLDIKPDTVLGGG